MKCTLQPIDEAIAEGVYEVELTDEQLDRLRSIFPDGVCDYTVPGVGQVAVADTWLSYPR